jgi:hypothetical protein
VLSDTEPRVLARFAEYADSIHSPAEIRLLALLNLIHLNRSLPVSLFRDCYKKFLQFGDEESSSGKTGGRENRGTEWCSEPRK